MIRTGKEPSHQTDMTVGPLLVNIVKFILPLIFTNLLQQFYHAADVMIVGLSSDPDAVGAVGSVGSYLALIRNLFIGFSVGANVVVAQNIGAGDRERTTRSVHTSVCMSLLFGVVGAAIGIALSRPVLSAMGYGGNLLTLGLRYSFIYLACMPFLSLTNVLCAILRAQGNTQTSLYVLTGTGILNIVLNLFFVTFLHFSVEGVAIATAIANLASACILWAYLAKDRGDCRLCFCKLRIHRKEFLTVARIGIPSGIQSSLFSVSNILIQSSILSVNNAVTPPDATYAPVIKGNTAASSIETFILQALDAATTTAATFTAQNAGASKYDRVRRAFGCICLISAVAATVLSGAGMLLRDPLLALYGVQNTEDPLGSLAYGAATTRIFWKWPAIFIYAIMNTCAGTIRGLGRSTLSTVIAFFGSCVLRIVWIYTVFAYFFNLETIYLSYPVSWLITGLLFLTVVFYLFRRYQGIGEKTTRSQFITQK
ncbi:MAG: polysaccharide biosynthesis C-terminal domain-containing protein [Clostridia bacterium]|nr:polysaccharide biosynthesis C-terminal domain-containing protein [Clostridia bacterium]